MKKDRSERLSELKKVTNLSSLNEEDVKKTREFEARLNWKGKAFQANFIKTLNNEYKEKAKDITNNQAPFPLAQVIRDLAFEYTARYKDHGKGNQPSHFEFFEPFLHIKLIMGVAPYAALEKEHHQLFSLTDFIDYYTSDMSNNFSLESLLQLPQDEIYHFSVNGDINEMTFKNEECREMIIAGFSMIRRGSLLHWYMLAGERLDDNAWTSEKEETPIPSNTFTPPHKNKFVENFTSINGEKKGNRVNLEETKQTQKIILSGEYDLEEKEHVTRCRLTEFENCFDNLTDNTSVMDGLPKDMIDKALLAIEQEFKLSQALWSMVEVLFQLPVYFNLSLALNKKTTKEYLNRIPKSKGGKGVEVRYYTIPSLTPKSEEADNTVIELNLPQYKIESDGGWKTIDPDEYGLDRHGNNIRGKTWIKSKTKMRANYTEKVVFVKNTLASAKLQIEEILKRVSNYSKDNPALKEKGELYIMKCEAMPNLYKVGYTDLIAEDRARNLSANSGVPVSFEVVKKWCFPRASLLEKDVHMKLDQYRYNTNREFFKVDLSIIVDAVESIILGYKGQ